MITWQELNRVAADILAITNEHKQIAIDHKLQPMIDSAELLRSHGLLGYVGNPDSQVEGATVFEITWEGRAFYSQWGNPDVTKPTNETDDLIRQIKDLKNQLAKLANLADRLDSQLVTRDDGIIESMYTFGTQQVRDNLHEAVRDTWIMLGEVVEE